ncbi:hypothetical protein CNE_1c04480 [Cupriavidus necator N-1]|uniref:Uncharacterized protein n=1 Tax=Cupriavidus necator (strain ATCC 43291 / DSM 13513 / CCUG 52238 / LMG 8453 / N-1) TaxID=1042878 RepID=G0EVA9_CUPNN|nr:hypothetical protein CNE_1c04480 [Cupriavidus necator N-1]
MGRRKKRRKFWRKPSMIKDGGDFHPARAGPRRPGRAARAARRALLVWMTMHSRGRGEPGRSGAADAWPGLASGRGCVGAM